MLYNKTDSPKFDKEIQTNFVSNSLFYNLNYKCELNSLFAIDKLDIILHNFMRNSQKKKKNEIQVCQAIFELLITTEFCNFDQ